MKVCRSCKQEKSLDSFYSHPGCKGGVNTICKCCHIESTSRRQKQNPERSAAATRRYRQANPEKCATATRRWRQANPGKQAAAQRRCYQTASEKYSAGSRQWYHANKKRANTRHSKRSKIRYASDPIFRLITNCRNRVRHALQGNLKSQKTSELIGCSVVYLNTWLELQFQEGMSWSNHGE